MPQAPKSLSTDVREPLWLSLVAIALAAGEIELKYFRGGGAAVTIKADASPVTVADMEAEALILARLRALVPDIAIVAEEEAAAGRIPRVDDRFLLVDPLDGTKEFVAGRGEFTVNIALVERRRPVLGVVYAPVGGKLFATTEAGTAVAADIQPGREPQFRRVRTRTPDMKRLVAVASRSHNNPETERFLARYAVTETVRSGSSLKFCTIAEGNADIYPRIGTTNEWDTAAGHAVLAAAGGCVTRLDGSPGDYGKAGERFRNPDYVAWGAPSFP